MTHFTFKKKKTWNKESVGNYFTLFSCGTKLFWVPDVPVDGPFTHGAIKCLFLIFCLNNFFLIPHFC